MAHVYVPYNNINDLVEGFQNLNLIRDAAYPESTANFVMIQPDAYFGSYGGLIFDSVLQHYLLRIRDTHSISDSIGHGLSLVWWNTAQPEVNGDYYTCAAEGRVAVTPKMFKHIRINTLRKTRQKSSYYTSKAWRINDASFSKSDSE